MAQARAKTVQQCKQYTCRAREYFLMVQYMEGHAKKCVERFCELANKTNQQLSKVVTPYIVDHQFKEKAMGFVAELSKICTQIVLKCSYLAHIGRPDFLCLTFITYVNSNNFVMWRIQHNYAYQDCFRILICRTSRRLKINIWRIRSIFGRQTFVPISWICKKQTSVSHSSTEAEIMSLDAGLSMDLNSSS